MPAETLLNVPAITRALGDRAGRFTIDLLSSCPSTNALLLARAEAGAPVGTVVIAETQTAGRGRRGNAWISAPADSLTFSLLWRFAPGTSPAGLSLAIGVAVALASAKVGAGGTAIQLKWPNDLLCDGKKAGGILVELLPGSPHAAVIGIGLNLRLPPAMPDGLRAHSAALPGVCDPNLLLAAILLELEVVLEEFAASGFGGLHAAWTRLHAYEGQPIRLLSDFAPAREGVCRGVDANGALLLEAEGRIERVLSGEVSLRGAP